MIYKHPPLQHFLILHIRVIILHSVIHTVKHKLNCHPRPVKLIYLTGIFIQIRQQNNCTKCLFHLMIPTNSVSFRMSLYPVQVILLLLNPHGFIKINIHIKPVPSVLIIPYNPLLEFKKWFDSLKKLFLSFV